MYILMVFGVCLFVCLERKEIRKRMMMGWRSVKA